VVVGGATGMIGDPSGRATERELLTAERAAANSARVRDQLARFVRFDGPNAAVMVNNLDWIGPISHVDWLRDVGKHFTVNYMLQKESVRSRLDREEGLSYTEFSYMILQAYDFLHLFESHDCRIQAGGNDQWGNITAGMDLIQRRHHRQAFGLTFPLVTTASGEKFGKSAGNAVWLAPDRTSPYQFYQYWIRTDDRDVGKYLNYFTFLSRDEIAGVLADHERNREARSAQRRLATEMTAIVHGPEGLAKAERATGVLFGGEVTGLSDADLAEVFADVPSCERPRAVLEAGVRAVDLLADTGVFASRGEAKRMIAGGGVYVNNRPVRAVDAMLTPGDLASETVLILRKGKKGYTLVRFR
jgi:tyrosyl-tRNA synthetase